MDVGFRVVIGILKYLAMECQNVKNMENEIGRYSGSLRRVSHN